MARRRKSSSRLTLVVIITLAAVAGIACLLISGILDPHRTVARLDILRYQESPPSFSGNRYVVEGEIAKRLAQNSLGTVYALASDGQMLAVVVPETSRPSFNIEKGQRLLVDIHVAEDGSAIATALSKK